MNNWFFSGYVYLKDIYQYRIPVEAKKNVADFFQKWFDKRMKKFQQVCLKQTKSQESVKKYKHTLRNNCKLFQKRNVIKIPLLEFVFRSKVKTEDRGFFNLFHPLPFTSIQVRVTSVGSSVGILTHQGYISEVFKNRNSASECSVSQWPASLLERPVLQNIKLHLFGPFLQSCVIPPTKKSCWF